MLQFLSFCTFENVITLHFNDISIGACCHSSTLPATFRHVTPLKSSHSADFTVSARGGYLHVSKPVLVIPFVAVGKELTKARTEDSQSRVHHGGERGSRSMRQLITMHPQSETETRAGDAQLTFSFSCNQPMGRGCTQLG